MSKILYFYDGGTSRKPTRMQIKPQAFTSFSLLIGILLCLTLGFQSCEKDDICIEGDTPLLVITFFDTESPTEAKSVTRLRVIGLGQEQVVGTFSDRANLDSIAIPLRSNASQTGFVFIFQSETAENGEETGNRDTLYFDYTAQEVFASRACGFVVQYEDLQAQANADDDTWIDSIEIKQASVTTSESAHVSIFH